MSGVGFYKRIAKWFGHVLRRSCLLRHVTDEKVKGRIEVTKRRGRRHKKLLDDLEETRGCWKLKEEAFCRSLWRTRSGRGCEPVVESIWNVMVHGGAREGEWRGNWRMEWVASTLHTTSEHGVSSINIADAHTSAVSSRLNWRPRRFKWTRPFRWKTKSGFCACAITLQTQSNMDYGMNEWIAVVSTTASSNVTVSWRDIFQSLYYRFRPR